MELALSDHDPACSAELANPTAAQQFVLDRTSTWQEYHAGMKVLTEWLALQNFHGVTPVFEVAQDAEVFGEKLADLTAKEIRKQKEPGGLLHVPSLGEIAEAGERWQESLREIETPPDPAMVDRVLVAEAIPTELIGDPQLKRKKVLLIMAHMDDESISCGGLIQNRIRDGYEVFILTCFDRLYDYGEGDQHVEEQRAHYTKALNTLNPDHIHGLVLNPPMPEGRPGRIDMVVALRNVEAVFNRTDPVEVIIHHEADLNQDHRFLNEVCRIVLRPSNLQNVRRILACHGAENLTKPTWVEELTEIQAITKYEAVDCYEREVRDPPHVRSKRTLSAKLYVVGAQVGAIRGEGYTLIMEKK